MKAFVASVVALVGLAAALAADDKPRQLEEVPKAKLETRPVTACHGTAVEFVDSPVVAAKLATEQKKLVLVLHVSGHFEDPSFT